MSIFQWRLDWFSQKYISLYLYLGLFFENRKNSGFIPGQMGDPVTRTRKMAQMTRWPNDPVPCLVAASQWRVVAGCTGSATLSADVRSWSLTCGWCVGLADCPTGFAHDSGRGTCLQLSTQTAQWSVASSRCRGLHQRAHLVVIDSHSKQKAVMYYLQLQGTDVTSYRNEQANINNLLQQW